jgi:hypothetical protein
MTPPFSSQQLGVALEAARRLRASYADAIALVAVLPGPATLAARLDADRAAPLDQRLPTHLVVRASPGPDPDLVRADDFSFPAKS